jgi:hypothetical protein
MTQTLSAHQSDAVSAMMVGVTLPVSGEQRNVCWRALAGRF